MALGAARCGDCALSVLAINFIGDGLRDALDPKGMLGSK